MQTHFLLLHLFYYYRISKVHKIFYFLIWLNTYFRSTIQKCLFSIQITENVISQYQFLEYRAKLALNSLQPLESCQLSLSVLCFFSVHINWLSLCVDELRKPTTISSIKLFTSSWIRSRLVNADICVKGAYCSCFGGILPFLSHMPWEQLILVCPSLHFNSHSKI